MDQLYDFRFSQDGKFICDIPLEKKKNVIVCIVQTNEEMKDTSELFKNALALVYLEKFINSAVSIFDSYVKDCVSCKYTTIDVDLSDFHEPIASHVYFARLTPENKKYKIFPITGKDNFTRSITSGKIEVYYVEPDNICYMNVPTLVISGDLVAFRYLIATGKL